MEPETLADIEKAVQYGWAGSSGFASELARPFTNAVEERIKGLGFVDYDQSRATPDFAFARRRPEGPRADLGVTAVIAVSVFLGTTVGGWAVKTVCDEIYDGAVRPAIVQFIANYKKRKKSRRGRDEDIVVRFDVWYDVDKLLVRVVGESSSADELEKINDLIPEAQRRALEWVERHGIAGKVMTYRVRYGQLTRFPEIAQQVPND